MLVVGFPAAAFATNCYVIAPAVGEECLVVDPGIGVLDQLAEVLAERGLRPAAVLLTHGHIDHVFSVTPVCGGHGVAAHVHADDRYRLVDPVASLDPSLRAMLVQQFGSAAHWQEPTDVVTFADGDTLDLAGLQVGVVHAPGHTEGSVMFRLPHLPDGVSVSAGTSSAGTSSAGTLLTGDVLFSGSIGRTDLPGGDHAAMMRSLRDKVLTQPDDLLVLPGHGPATTIGRERVANPYLREVAALG